jgi:uncharacterized membrane protein YsdA (DUF1294 family)
MNEQSLYIVAFFLIINLSAFLIMLFDKIESRKIGASRISEGLLFFLAVAFGGVGVYLGMFIFHHKISKWYFIAGIPLAIVQNIAFLYLVYAYLIERA